MAASSVPQFASLYVGDLHLDVTEAMLYEIFNSVGPVGSIRVCRDSVTRRSLGYGYINFHAVADAERALDTLNYSSIKGRACRIMWSQRDPTLRKSGVGNIYVSNLDRSIDNKALYDTFSLFGNILSCKVASDIEGKSFGYGFVHYETEEAAKQSIERVNGMQIGEKTVHVAAFTKSSEREPKNITEYTNLYIKGFPEEWAENIDEKVKEVFGAYGEISSSCVMESKGRKFAFVNFAESSAALKCVEEQHGKDHRTEEQKKAAEEKAADDKEEKEKEDDIQGILYVQRAMSKAERARQFKAQQVSAGAPAKSGATGVNLYVKNLEDTTDDDALRALFEPFGTITSAKAVTEPEKGVCKGFGFVCFASPDDATKAVTEMHLKVVKGKPLYVGLAEKREARAERLNSRYNVGAGGTKGGKGGSKGGKGGFGMQGGGFGKGMSPMGGGPQMGGMMGGPQMGGMMPMGGMMGGQQMGGMMGKGGPQMGGMMGKGPMMGGPQMGGKGPMMGMGGPMAGPGPMMGNPQMMMSNPQMMQMMQQKGQAQMMQQKGQAQMMQQGMMRPMMPPQMQGARPPMPAQMQAAQAGGPPSAPPGSQRLDASVLAAAPPAVQKQMIGEKLFPAIAKFNPEIAGKVTGMMLEMDNSELIMLLESEAQLKLKVQEAMQVLGGK